MKISKIFLSTIMLAISFSGNLLRAQAIIADHSIVEDYAIIPQQYIELIKTKWLSYAGESHSEAIRAGLEALEDIDSRFQVSTIDNGTPQGPTTSYLRVSRATWGDLTHSSGWIYHYGEEDWFTSQAAVNRTIAGLSYMNENGFPLDYFGFGWCYDAADGGVSGGIDPVYHTRWGGVSIGGPDGNRAWGLDNEDAPLTGNSIDMQDYIDATLAYIQHCESNQYPTRVFFTTGTIDNEYGLAVGETGYQAFLKWEYLRNFVRSTNYALFDFADILSYNNDGVQETTSWTDHSSIEQVFPVIHPNNLDGGYMAHIGMNGALRLAKAMWWMIARLEGWNGLPEGTTDIQAPSVPQNLQAVLNSVTSVTLSWEASSDNIGVTGYRIYRDGAQLDYTENISYTDNSVLACTNYTFFVTAVDAAENESAESINVFTNVVLENPEATITQPTCTEAAGSIVIASPSGSGIEYSINNGSTWVATNGFSGLAGDASYTVSVRDAVLAPDCISSSVFFIDASPVVPGTPVVRASTLVNECPSETIDLIALVTSSLPSGGSLYFKIINDPSGEDVPNPTAAGEGNYYLFYRSQDGCYSVATEVSVSVTQCPFDLAPTLIVTPNITHGTTSFDVIVKVTELNLVTTDGEVRVSIPVDTRWSLSESYDPALTSLGGVYLNNNAWSYSPDATHHVFTSSAPIPGGEFTCFGFRVSFIPNAGRGLVVMNAEVSAAGEERVGNNGDSERVDFFE